MRVVLIILIIKGGYSREVLEAGCRANSIELNQDKSVISCGLRITFLFNFIPSNFCSLLSVCVVVCWPVS